jgi:hypothetical protein
MRFRWSTFGAVALAVMCALSACGPSEAEKGDGEQPNWDLPIAGSTPLSSATDADLAFEPTVPDILGTAEQIIATSPIHAPASDREIAWIYDDPTYSRFAIIERLVDQSATLAEYNALASTSEGCTSLSGGSRVECHYGKRSMVKVRDGVSAFLLEGDVTTALHWLEPVDPSNKTAFERYEDPAVEVVVLGPAGTFTSDNAMEVANKV